MGSEVAARQEGAVENPVAGASRGEVLARYHHLRDISTRHHSKVLDFLSRDAVLHHASRLGLTVDKMLVVDRTEELTFAFDLAIYTAPAGRSRAIGRYARSAELAPGSDEALVLEAMCRAQFAIVRVERRHETAGLVVNDVLRGIEHWLVDQGLESSVPDGYMLVTRLFTPESFSMTAGVNVPITRAMLEVVLDEVPQVRRKTPADGADDRRFAEAIYRVALAGGVMKRVTYQNPMREAG
jgi:hypothetical protein